MAEQAVAAIPRLQATSISGLKEYSVVLTDQRIIFVHQSGNFAGFAAGVLGGAVGSAIASAANGGPRAPDYASADPAVLAADDHNVVIPYTAIRRMRIKKGLAATSFVIEFTREDGKGKKLEGYVKPPTSYLEEVEGMKPKEAWRQYAQSVAQTFQSHLPPAVAPRLSVEL